MVSKHGWTLTPYLPSDTTPVNGNEVPVTPGAQCGDYDIRARCVQQYDAAFNSCLNQGETPTLGYPREPLTDPSGYLWSEKNTIGSFQGQVPFVHYGRSGVGEKNSWSEVRARYLADSEDLSRNRLNVLWSSLTHDEQEATRCLEIKFMSQKPITSCYTGQYRVNFDRPCRPMFTFFVKGECVANQKRECIDCCIRSNGNLQYGDWCANASSYGSGSGSGVKSLVSNFVTGNKTINELLTTAPVSLPYDIVNSIEIENVVYNISYLGTRYDVITKSLNSGGLGSGSSTDGTGGNNNSLAQECQGYCNTIFNDLLGALPGRGGVTTRKLQATLVEVKDGRGGFGSPGYQKHYNDCHDKYSSYVTKCVETHRQGPIGGDRVNTGSRVESRVRSSRNYPPL